MNGIHLLGQWFECAETHAFNDASTLRSLCLALTQRAGLSAVGDRFHQFEPGGVTGTVLLAESHLAIHTWPEERFATVDVFVCNFQHDNTAKATLLLDLLREALAPGRVQEQAIRRSNDAPVRKAA
jgi:S-adenosylmethionine decarboxylase proenzyme